MTKQEIAAVFEEIGTLLDLKGANPFRVRAYANAARTIDSLQQDLDTLVAENRLTEIKGIGDDLAAKTIELQTTGKLRFHEELKASMPAGLLDMLRIPGFGPKRAKVVYEKLGCDSVDKLEAACKAGKIAAAAIDVTAEEPLPGPSPLWDLPNVFVTPHTAGETRAYEDNVIDILLENLGRLWKGEKTLRNQVL